MELRQLKYFIAAADSGSITAAARKLFVVQSAVSHQIGNLEVELMTVLLERSKTGVTLTPAGQLLYRHAVAVVKQLAAVSHEVQSADKEIRGRVAIGIPNSTAAVLALPLLTAVRSELPFAEFTLVEGLSGLLAEQLSTGRLDLSILFDSAPIRGLQVTPLVTERLHFVSSDPQIIRRYFRAASIKLKEVISRPLILPPQPNGIRALLEREASRLNLQPNVVADITGIGTMLAAVSTGLADTLMMAVNAKSMQSSSLLVIPVSAPTIEREACLFEPSQFALPTAAMRVRDITLRLVNELVRDGRWPGARLLKSK